MKLPRNISAKSLIKTTEKLGYKITRQTGSHIRLTTIERGQHHITVPNHDPIKIGTLSGIISDIANHFQTTKEDITEKIF